MTCAITTGPSARKAAERYNGAYGTRTLRELTRSTRVSHAGLVSDTLPRRFARESLDGATPWLAERDIWFAPHAGSASHPADAGVLSRAVSRSVRGSPHPAGSRLLLH